MMIIQEILHKILLEGKEEYFLKQGITQLVIDEAKYIISLINIPDDFKRTLERKYLDWIIIIFWKDESNIKSNAKMSSVGKRKAEKYVFPKTLWNYDLETGVELIYDIIVNVILYAYKNNVDIHRHFKHDNLLANYSRIEDKAREVRRQYEMKHKPANFDDYIQKNTVYKAGEWKVFRADKKTIGYIGYKLLNCLRDSFEWDYVLDNKESEIYALMKRDKIISAIEVDSKTNKARQVRGVRNEPLTGLNAKVVQFFFRKQGIKYDDEIFTRTREEVEG